MHGSHGAIATAAAAKAAEAAKAAAGKEAEQAEGGGGGGGGSGAGGGATNGTSDGKEDDSGDVTEMTTAMSDRSQGTTLDVISETNDTPELPAAAIGHSSSLLPQDAESRIPRSFTFATADIASENGSDVAPSTGHSGVGVTGFGAMPGQLRSQREVYDEPVQTVTEAALDRHLSGEAAHRWLSPCLC